MLEERKEIRWASSTRKVLSFLNNALNSLNVLQVALKYSNKVIWGDEGRERTPGPCKARWVYTLYQY